MKDAISRRNALTLLAGAPLAALGGCCLHRYPKPMPEGRSVLPMPPMLGPQNRSRARAAFPVVDVHAHFFNASDVPVRGFIEDCLGHSAPPAARPLLLAMSRIAERLGDLAPTAAEELRLLDQMVIASRDGANAFELALADERADAARRVAEATRNSEFQRLYRRMTQGVGRNSNPAASLSADEVLQVLDESEQPSPQDQRALATRARPNADAEIADGMLGFLNYMLSSRWTNLRSYMRAYTLEASAFGTDTVLGALVDFDHWLDCPPRSAHDDQVRLHQRLSELSRGYMRPVVAYNPWTDINQNGAGLARVIKAFTTGDFVAVKIYPPTGFRPAANASSSDKTRKSRPPLPKLDHTLKTFFDACGQLRIPVIAHAAHSNGRDVTHDDFGGPAGWNALLLQYAQESQTPVISFGHFGGGKGTTWTQDFADLMGSKPQIALYGDLGYWEELVCPAPADADCQAARTRLKRAMAVHVPGVANGVADRTMFATDWLMLSQVKRWPDYPAKLLESLQTIVPEAQLARLFGGNAMACFAKLQQVDDNNSAGNDVA